MRTLLQSTALTILFSSSTAFAQAWIGPQNTLEAALDYSLNLSDTTYVGELSVTGAPVTAHGFVLGLGYSPFDNFAVRSDISFMGTVYSGPLVGTGPAIFIAHGGNDDGSLHVTPTDFSLALAYMIIDDPVAITPHIKGSIPVTDYETRGYAAAGQGLKKFSIGLNFGMMGLVLPGAYVHADYAFTIVERDDRGGEATSSYDLNRSDASIQLGYFIFDELSVGLSSHLLFVHGGFNFEDYGTVPQEVIDYHDALVQSRALLVGLSASYAITDDIALNAGFDMVTWGNSTSNAKIFHLGVAWSHAFGSWDSSAPAEEVLD